MIPYRKISEDTSIISFFNELATAAPTSGPDKGKPASPSLSKISEGYIPSEKELIAGLKQYYKNTYKKKEFDPQAFAHKIQGAMEHLKGMVLKGTGKERGSLDERARTLEMNVSFLEQVLKAKHKFLEQLKSNPEAAANVLESEKKRMIVKVKLPDGSYVDIRHSPDFAASLENKVLWDNKEVPQVEFLINTIRKGRPTGESPLDSQKKIDYDHAMKYVSRFVEHDLEEVKKHLNEFHRELKHISNMGSHLDVPLKEIQVKVPEQGAPMINVNTMLHAPRKTENTETKTELAPNPYNWLLKQTGGRSWADVTTKNLMGLVKDEEKGTGFREVKPGEGIEDKGPSVWRPDIYRIKEKKSEDGTVRDWQEKYIMPLSDKEYESLVTVDRSGKPVIPTEDLPSKLQELRKNPNFEKIPKSVQKHIPDPGTKPMTKGPSETGGIPKKKLEDVRSLKGELAQLHELSRQYMFQLKRFLSYDKDEATKQELREPLILDFVRKLEHPSTGKAIDVLGDYKAWVKALKDKLSEKQFHELIDWSEQGGFEVPDNELDKSLLPYRSHITKFFDDIERKDKENVDRFFKHWKPALDAMGELKEKISKVNNLLENLKRKPEFNQGRKGKPRSIFIPWERKKAFLLPYEKCADASTSIEGYFNKSLGSIEEVITFINSTLIPSEKAVEGDVGRSMTEDEWDAFIKDGDKLETYLKEFGDKVDTMEKYVNGYFNAVKKLHAGIRDTSALKLTKKKVEEKEVNKTPAPVEEDSYLTSPHFMSKASSELRVIAYMMDLMDKIGYDVLRSDFPKIIPMLYGMGKNPNMLYDYYVKSGPAEEIVEQLKEKSRNGGLDPAQFKAVIKETEGSFNRQMFNLQENAGKVLAEAIAARDEKSKIIQESINKAKKTEESFSDEFKKLLNVAKKVPGLDEARRESIKKMDEDRIKITGELLKMFDNTSEYNVEQASRLMKELGKIKTEMRDVSGELGTVVHPGTGKQVSVQSLSEEMGRRWEQFESDMAQTRSRIREADKWMDSIGNRIVTLKKITESKEGIPSKIREKAWKMWVLFLWNILDEHWMRKIQDFQAMHNSNFQDYIGIHDEVTDIVKHPVESRFFNRIQRGIKEERKFLRAHPEHVVPGNLKNIEEALQRMKSKGMQEVPGYESSESKEASVYNYPTEMSYSICSKFAGVIEPESYMDLILR